MDAERKALLDRIAEDARDTVRFPGKPIINPIRGRYNDPIAHDHWEDELAAERTRRRRDQ